MPDKILGKTKPPVKKEPAREKDVVVRIVSPAPETKHVNVINEADAIRDYSEEVKLNKSVNLLNGLAIGAGIGVLVCALAAFLGLSLDVGDMAAIVAVPMVLGIIAGYILS